MSEFYRGAQGTPQVGARRARRPLSEIAGRHDPLADLPVALGRNLKQLRARRGYSLDKLAQISGVSRAMIGQIEIGKSMPTVSLLLRVASALKVELTSLLATQAAPRTVVLRKDDAQVLHASGGKFTSRDVLPLDAARTVDFHEVRIAPRHDEQWHASPPGTRKNLIIAQGAVRVEGAGFSTQLDAGDALQFDADMPHTFCNLRDDEAVLYLLTRHPAAT